jgi:hypothetical protein
MESNKSESEVDFEINDTNCQKLVEQFVVNINISLILVYIQYKNNSLIMLSFL